MNYSRQMHSSCHPLLLGERGHIITHKFRNINQVMFGTVRNYYDHMVITKAMKIAEFTTLMISV
jgi:hypothetical protein